MAGRKSDFTLTKLDDLFSTQEQRDEEKLSKIRDIPLTEIDDFPDHPFKVRDDEDMAQLIESIKERGVITPATVRQKEDGRYELISGHRRKRACELAGFDTLRCEVVELNRDEATILMVESNYQRSQILPSEKAYAYKMRLEALSRQGKRTDLTSDPVGWKSSGKETAQLIGEQSGDSQTQVRRYIRLKCTECGYEMEAQLVARTPVTNIAATVTAPALGQKPDYAPVIVANPADSVDLEEVYWYKIAVADFTGTDGDDWDKMASDEAFTTGYYYSVDMYFDTNDGYKMSESATGTVNGMPHDDTYGELYEGDSAAYLCGLFEPLETEYTVDLPFSLAVKLTGDEKPAKETFKFEIYDLGVEDAEFEIVKDSITAENIAFDENGVAFIEGSLKIKVTGEDQLRNLREGFSVRMVKGSTKGWTYASEQWRIEPFFENDALDLKIAVQEIVDGKISEAYANGMSFSVGYKAVTEPETPQTGDSSMMVLWIALLFASGFGVVTTAVYGKKRKTVK